MADWTPNGGYQYKGDWYSNPAFPIKLMEEASEFRMSPEDVLLVTYRKAGTTWTQQIIDLIHRKGSLEGTQAPIDVRVPFLEGAMPPRPGCPPPPSAVTQLKQQSPPRRFFSHLHYPFFEKQVTDDKVKVVYVYRNPKDNIVSNFHFYRMNVGTNFKGDFNDFFEVFKNKRLIGGDFFDNVLGWWEQRHRPNVFVTSFEDMKKYPHREIKKMADFMGTSLTPDELDNVVLHSSFKKMKDNPATNHANIPIFRQEISPFMRKGDIGDWKNYFSPEQSAYVDKTVLEKCDPVGLKFDFE